MGLAGKRVAVTGATGFIGGYVARELAAAGAIVIAVVERSRQTPRHSQRPAAETVCFDAPDELTQAVRSAQPEYVVHLHAAISPAREVATVETMMQANLLPSVALMTACLEMQVKRLVLLGSGEEFGPRTGRFDDRSVPDPVSPYGASKAAVTCFARMYANVFGLAAVVLRPAVVYGPGQSARMLIPQVMQALADGRPVPTTKGEQTRDFIHVADVARGIVASLTAEGITGRNWNLATGRVVTVRECLEKMEQVTGISGLVQYGALPYRKGELFQYEPEVQETFQALAWQPEIGLDAGLEETWEAFQK